MVPRAKQTKSFREPEGQKVLLPLKTQELNCVQLRNGGNAFPSREVRQSQQIRSVRQIKEQTLPVPHIVLYPPPLPSLQGPFQHFPSSLSSSTKNKKQSAFMQISHANRCLGTHKLQGFIRQTQENLNYLRAQKICYPPDLSAGLKMGCVNL